jgi:hypothetical protein
MWAAGMPQPEEPSPQGSWTPEWIEQGLTEERKFILEVASGAIGEMLEEAAQARQARIQRLRLEVTQLELSLTELTVILPKERGLNSSSQLTYHSVN